MSFLELLRDYFHRPAAKNLNEKATDVPVVTEWEESTRGSFAFLGTEFVAGIEVDGTHAERIWYGINPLKDGVYIYKLILRATIGVMVWRRRHSGDCGAITKYPWRLCTKWEPP